ncbi:unnamed protein product, partial [Allacma fusca]
IFSQQESMDDISDLC